MKRKVFFLILISGFFCFNLLAQKEQTKWMDGKWLGIGYQPSEKVYYQWTISLDYNSSSGEFKIDYPTLYCGGHWTLKSANDHRAEFVEHIDTGKDKCNDLGRVVVTFVDEGIISVVYFTPGGGVIAYAVLKRT